ncbi:MAG: hypothetical protein IKB16_14190 [Lentisphaeria bacterium]|nr:hypothetical protein [Lentisphaeria bacterium]
MATQQYFKFAENAWNPDEWMIVRSPRWTDVSHWEQNVDHIANYVPADLRPEDMQMGRDRTGETYISMLLKQPVTGNAQMATTCSFDGRMAPLIVLSRELGPVHHEHLEVVVYDRGVNLWHHFYENGKPYWKLISFLDLDLKAGEKCELTTEILFAKKGKFLIMGCNGKTFGCRIADDWPETYYVGFTACEGKNRFYDFTLTPGSSDSPVMKERFSD